MIFLNNESYISGQLKLTLLISEWILVLISLEFSIVFYIRVKNKQKYELKSLQEKGYIWLFFTYSISYIFYIIGDYYVSLSLRLIFYSIGYLILMIGAFVFIRTIEKYRIFIRKNFFSNIFIILIIVYLIFLIISIEFSRIISPAFWFIFILFFIYYLKAINVDYYKKKELNIFKFQILKILFGFSLIMLGYGIATDLIVGMFGLISRFLGNILQLLGFTLIFFFLITVPSFSEFNWQDKIESLIITHKSGLFIYRKIFRDYAEELDETIVSGGLTLIKMMLESITHSEDILFIEKQGRMLIIQPGNYIIGVLICDLKLDSLQILLNKFVKRIEEIYEPILKDWQGELGVFKPIEDIAKEIFF